MQKINQIFGKEVINQTSGEKIATVHDVVLDRDTRQIVALVVRSGGLLGSNSVVRWGSIMSVGDVVVVQTESELPAVKDDAEVADLVKQSYRITGTSVISDKGEQLGTVGDIFINERGEIIGYEVKHGLLQGSKYLPAEQVQAAGKDAVISRLGELPRLKDIEKESSTGDTSDVVAAPSIQTLGADETSTSYASSADSSATTYAYDEPVAASTEADSHSYSDSEPNVIYTDTADTVAPAYSAQPQDEPARIYAHDTADAPVAFDSAAEASAYAFDTPDELVGASDDEPTSYRADATDEPAMIVTDDEPTGYRADAMDEPVMADPDVVALSADTADDSQPHAPASDQSTDPYAKKSDEM